jgi:hypothetical protein
MIELIDLTRDRFKDNKISLETVEHFFNTVKDYSNQVTYEEMIARVKCYNTFFGFGAITFYSAEKKNFFDPILFFFKKLKKIIPSEILSHKFEAKCTLI